MDGVHDMGGVKERFGPIQREENEPVFHAPWEGRVYGMRQTVGPVYRLGSHRYNIEKLPPEVYLSSRYYDKWLRAFIACLEDKGMITEDELAAEVAKFEATPDAPPTEHIDPEFTQRTKARIFRKSIVRLNVEHETPLFQPGDAVTVLDLHPKGHIRLPHYLKGKSGVVERYQGYYDIHDHERYEDPLPPPRPLYAVSFDRHDIWGPQSEPGRIVADLWEHYLEPPSQGASA
ncbi:MAG: nitrile hydratase subunit beta [Dehalococcoidia bacterium]